MDYQQLKLNLSKNTYTWLITGVAGFIGSHLLEQLLKLNQQVIGLDNFATGFKSNFVTVLDKNPNANRFVFIEADIRDAEACLNASKHVDYILHQAALGSVPRSLINPKDTHETNTTGFVNILKAAVTNQVKRVIYASSSSVYGDSAQLPKIETHKGKLLSPYAVSKYTGELYADVFARCYGIESIGLRYFNVFGNRQDPNGPYAAVIPRWIQGVLNNQPVIVNGDGKTSRDFCYIENVVQANLLAALADVSAANHVYNVAVGEQHTLMELLSFICQLSDNGNYNQIQFNDFRPGDIRHSLADISKAKKCLGYQPLISLKEGLARMLIPQTIHA